MSRRTSFYPKKQPYPLMTFFVEGEVTEREYIKSLKEKLLSNISNLQRRRTIHSHIKIAEKTAQTPLSLVRLAISSQPQKKDMCVIVIDEDGRTSSKEINARNQAIQIAQNQKFVFVYSVPCFEFWGLLHLQNTTASLSSAECQEKLKNVMPKYNHHKKDLKLDFELLYPHHDEATSRAVRLISSHTKKCHNIDLENPTTNAYLIKSEIEKFIANFPK